MNYLLFSVKDILSGRFFDVKVLENVDCAKRWFRDLAQKSPYGKDLQLFQLGMYNIETGNIVPCFDFICGGADNEE